jgi:diaminobutyrate-2-oxoglutarate transaminase
MLDVLDATLSSELLARQSQRESNARTYPRRFPLAIKSARGIHVTDMNGRVFIDCLAGAGTLALGHNHPVVVDAIRRHLDSGAPLHTLDLTTEAKDAFVRELFDSLPPGLRAHGRIQFCGPSGSDAIEAALKLVKTATGRRTILGFHGGYHGHTHGSLALMGNVAPKTAISGLMPDVHFLPYPHPSRCPLGCTHCDGAHCADYVEHLLQDPESGVVQPAGMILEVVQGEGGSIPAPDAWLQRIRQLTREHKIPLIIDEVQTGWGRTGLLYACQHAGVEPDVLVLSKAIGGSLPLSVVIYHEDLDVWQPGAHAGTFRGNQLAMAAGRATLQYLNEHAIPAHAHAAGNHLQSRLRTLQVMHPCIGEVRGRGLMVGMEIVDPRQRDRRGLAAYDGGRARAIQQACFERGLIIEVGGRHSSVLRFLPPLIVTAAQLDDVCDIVDAACTATRNSRTAAHAGA